MHFSKFLSSFVALGLLGVLSVADDYDKNSHGHLAAAGENAPSVPAPTAFPEARNVENVDDEAATTKKSATKKPPATRSSTRSSAHTAAPSRTNSLAGLAMTMTGKKHAAPSKAATSCRKRTRRDINVGITKSNASPVEARAPTWKAVAEAQSVAGTATEGLYTWQLKTCIGITAFDPTSKKKVLAHITALTGTQDYKDQFAEFRTKARSNTGSAREVSVTLAPLGYAPQALHALLTEMNNYIKAEAAHLDGNLLVIPRQVVDSGSEMSIADNGAVTVDGACWA